MSIPVHRQGGTPPSRVVGLRFVCRATAVVLALALPAVAGAAICSVAAPAADFGNYDVFSASAVTTTTTISVDCTLEPGDGGGNTTVAYALALSAGAGNAFVLRQMKNGSDSLGYNLYVDSANTRVWGDGSGTSRTVSGSLRLNPGHPDAGNSHTVYATAPPLQDVGVGTYADTLLLTITY